ncbi:hypothetical protein E6R60_26845 [Streptomyces sp. A0642]|uniref:hypothetical protein n=1 Tax=Streptomyces sp. A0642 TaxID=2563100 RepID=UPI0010A2757E|nr:hypothetical protein [Streptomyces sp. A0642]THA72549.1 hypothetical protein E6R60_26845 [Streptomyces sp. A0642]
MTLRPVEAHQSGDGITIAHCPFCGSGQVIGRSDGNTECSFCNQSFLVRVQPTYSAFPQSVGGAPVDIPGMPDPAMGGMPPGGAPGEEGMDDGGGTPPFGGDADGDDQGAEGPPDDSEDDSGGGAPPFGKKESSYRTGRGQRLSRPSYIGYLAGLLEAK